MLVALVEHLMLLGWAEYPGQSNGHMPRETRLEGGKKGQSKRCKWGLGYRVRVAWSMEEGP